MAKKPEYLEEDLKTIFHKLINSDTRDKFIEKLVNKFGEDNVFRIFLKKFGKEVLTIAASWEVQVIIASTLVSLIKEVYKYFRNVSVAKEDKEYSKEVSRITGKKIKVHFTQFKTSDVVTTLGNAVVDIELKQKLTKDELVAYIIAYYVDFEKIMLNMISGQFTGMVVLEFLNNLENMLEERFKKSHNYTWAILSMSVKILIFEIIKSITKSFFESKTLLLTTSRSAKKYGIQNELISALNKLKDEPKPQPDSKLGQVILKIEKLFKSDPDLNKQIKAIQNDPEKMEIMTDYMEKSFK